jgi:hypothetical protein
MRPDNSIPNILKYILVLFWKQISKNAIKSFSFFILAITKEDESP